MLGFLHRTLTASQHSFAIILSTLYQLFCVGNYVRLFIWSSEKASFSTYQHHSSSPCIEHKLFLPGYHVYADHSILFSGYHINAVRYLKKHPLYPCFGRLWNWSFYNYWNGSINLPSPYAIFNTFLVGRWILQLFSFVSTSFVPVLK